MSLFKSKNSSTLSAPQASAAGASSLAEMVLNVIHDGVVMIDGSGVVRFINPAAVAMAGVGSVATSLGLDYGLVIRLESKDGSPFADNVSPLAQAIRTNQPLEPFQCRLRVGRSDKKVPISISAFPSGDGGHVITFRDITKELAEESERGDFISTASHEMRTPVASIEGYLSLALNPQTATIDSRAKGYLDAAHAASRHLGKLFQDLLDTTKLDDGHIRQHPIPVEMMSLVGNIVQNHLPQAAKANLQLLYGAEKNVPSPGIGRRLQQTVYSYLDEDFLQEVLDNLIENGIKYTPAGGSIYVNVRGEGDHVLVSVADTGKGIASDDLEHIFQKFYRVDNSDTRTIGGTGLGLYLVKQRVEAMGGRVWAESVFGEGATFFVSLPRISADEYEKRMIPFRNQQAMQQQAGTLPGSVAAAGADLANPSPVFSTQAPPAPATTLVAPPTTPNPAITTLNPGSATTVVASNPVSVTPDPGSAVAPSGPAPVPAAAVPIPNPNNSAQPLFAPPTPPAVPPLPPTPPITESPPAAPLTPNQS